MHREVIMAGFGGQGVMTMGKNLVEGGVEEGYEAIWVPSYGPEMRGGTSNCTVVLSDKRIGSPIVEHPSELIAMNRPSLAKFVDAVKSGGTIFVNSSTVSDKVERDDVTTYYVPSDAIAQELGNVKASNMVMLGAYIGATNAVKVETVEQMIHHIFASKEKLIPLNLDALHKGIESVK